ncbi:GNAT family N-acetyltransferase [Polynucleobacter sp. AP-Nino-20-G2]|uniref:GNAT family N-acetyltransferase n=1 Tax=Polynucleobacter sp. AP-Nino-20-G2 TaxID=2576917 RepID=UPI001BFDE11A|nr:GNAT family N-acetyltransferase [Polynucleobacter sp. AP-Nino-20-G2]QWE15885.1 GNAT family N-acetyltransferase [Polynucleobacter sp. AP-Nino-20-G2]
MILIQSWPDAQEEAYPIRKSVFVQEQGVPEEMELDDQDPKAHHALVYSGRQCVGTARLIELTAHQSQIGRMAVLKSHRSQGYGTMLIKALITLGKELGVSQFILHAQLSAIPFYEQFGFVPLGDAYDEAGIPHRDMILDI